MFAGSKGGPLALVEAAAWSGVHRSIGCDASRPECGDECAGGYVAERRRAECVFWYVPCRDLSARVDDSVTDESIDSLSSQAQPPLSARSPSLSSTPLHPRASTF
eukprot:6210125-Pleurochrysis_carterae.AAC.1